MDSGILQSIEIRREALYAHYDLPPEERRKAEALFARMERLGQGCRDQADFEQKFMTQTLNREYNNLFVEFTAYVKMPEGVPTKQEYARQIARDRVESTVAHHAKVQTRRALFSAMPEGMRRWSSGGIYKIPVLGSIVSALNLTDTLGRLFVRRKKKRDADAESCDED